jgi:hypothetical protein
MASIPGDQAPPEKVPSWSGRDADWLSHIEYDWSSQITSSFLHASNGRDSSAMRRKGGRLSDRTGRNSPCDVSARSEAVVDPSTRTVRLLGTSQVAIAIAYAARHLHRVSRLIATATR